MWTKAGIGRAVALDPKDPATLVTLKEATFIWFPGGDQNRLMKAFEGYGRAGCHPRALP